MHIHVIHSIDNVFNSINMGVLFHAVYSKLGIRCF